MTQLLFWAQSRPSLTVLFFVVIVLLLKELMLSQLRKGIILYYAFLFPGVVLHEASHALFCLLMFAPIKKIQFFSKTGGFVMHQESKIPLVGDFLISIAPLVVEGLLFYFLISKFNTGSLLIKVILGYLEVTLLITMAPSFQDILNSAAMYLAITISLVALIFSGLYSLHISPEAVNIMYFCLVLLIVVNLILAVANFVNKSK